MIYFVQGEESGDIKIGTTIRLSVRLKALRTVADEPIRLLGVLNGSYADEEALHARFSHLWICGEWFTPAEELVSFIAEETRPWDGTDESDVCTLFAVKGDPAWYDWLKRYVDFLGISLTTAIDIALREQAKRDKFPDPMPKRFGR